jgi:hypothetical protein
MVLPILTIVIVLSTTMVKADFNVTIGQDNDYEVTTSDWAISVGGNSGGGSGVNIEDVGYAEGSTLNIEVTGVSLLDVDYDMTVGVDVYPYTSSAFGNIFFFAFTLFLPMLMPSMVGGTWDQAAVDMGPGLWGDFFLDTSFSDVCYELANNQTALDELTEEETDITFKKVAAEFENDTAIAVFDWALDMEWVNSSTNTDFGGKFRYKIAFDQTTSWVKGWRLFMDYDGTVEGTILDIVWNQLVQQSGYTVGNFAIKTGLFPGFEWFLAFPVLGLLAVPVIYKKRK